MGIGLSLLRCFAPRCLGEETGAATTGCFWRRCTIAPSTTSPGGLCRNGSGSGTASGEPERLSGSGPDVRQHAGAGPCLGGGRKRGQEDQAPGRSRGGFSTKIHLKTDLDGHPLAFDLTGGQIVNKRLSRPPDGRNRNPRVEGLHQPSLMIRFLLASLLSHGWNHVLAYGVSRAPLH